MDDQPEKPSRRDRFRAWVKKFLGKVWTTGGGGYYGLGYLCTFLWLETRLLFSEMAEADGVVDFIAGQLVERVFKLAFESLMNSIEAFLWPITLLVDYEIWGAVTLAGTYFLYRALIHQRLVNLLGVDPEKERKAQKQEKRAQKEEKKALKQEKKAHKQEKRALKAEQKAYDKAERAAKKAEKLSAQRQREQDHD